MGKKIAIIVEGRTELILVRDYLLRQFNYDVNIFCISVRGNSFDKNDKIIGFENSSSENHFYLLNANSDTQVIPKILQMEEFLITKEGYEKIIGLRDMFSEEYENESSNKEIREEINEKIRERSLKDLALKGKYLDKIEVCFSIMETEAWFLGLYEIFEKIDSQLTSQYIFEKLNINLEEVDPETEIFHPASLVKKIYKLVDKDYRKKKDDIEKITSQISKEEYEVLLERDKCQSFNNFHDAIFES